MQALELVDRRPETELDRRIATIMRVKVLGGELSAIRERRFNEMMRLARAGAASTTPAIRTAASSLLDVLALELCDE